LPVGLYDRVVDDLEGLELLSILDSARSHRQEKTTAHATYSRLEVLAAIGKASVTKPGRHREGVYYGKRLNLYVCFVTLQKTERDFSPLTRYKDCAISEELFHWETQHSVSIYSPTGRRLLNQHENGMRVLVFVREAQPLPGVLFAAYRAAVA